MADFRSLTVRGTNPPETVLINLDHVRYLSPMRGGEAGTNVVFEKGDGISVVETLNQIEAAPLALDPKAAKLTGLT